MPPEDATTPDSTNPSDHDTAANDDQPTAGDWPTTDSSAQEGMSDVRPADEAPVTEDGGATPPSEADSRARPARPTPDTFLDERDDVLAVINELEDQLDRYEEIRETLEREVTEARQQNQAARQRVQELEWQTMTLQTRVEALEQVRQDVSLLEEEIADANARAQRLAEQHARAEKENTRISSELKSANKQLEELWAVRKERDGLRVDVKNTLARLDQLERAHQEILEERSTLQARLQETQVAFDETRSARNQAEIELRAADDRNEELRRTAEDTLQKFEALRAEKKSLQVQLTHVERENVRLIEQQQFHECELTSLRSMNRNAEAALANVKKAFAEVRVALAETKSRARRRTLESWPRTCAVLRGMGETVSGDVHTESGEAIVPGASQDDARAETEQVAVTEEGDSRP